MPSTARTPKGRRESEKILDAATAVMARDGLSGATLGRIAAEAGVDKRMLAYYFGSRENLWAEVVRRFGRRLAEGVAIAALEGVGPYEVAAASLETIWDGAVIHEPELTRAYVVLAAGRSNSDTVRAALDETEILYVKLFEQGVRTVEANGYVLIDDRRHFVTAMFALLRGLLMEWAEHGDSADLAGARETFKRLAAASFIGRPLD